jgi:hypothetical protein
MGPPGHRAGSKSSAWPDQEFRQAIDTLLAFAERGVED